MEEAYIQKKKMNTKIIIILIYPNASKFESSRLTKNKKIITY